MSTPIVQIAKPHAGVLPMPAVDSNTSQKRRPKPPVERTKAVLRRLPPGLTEKELTNILGDEWKPGNGKVSWFRFSPGKISMEIGKPSKPACAFFQVTDKAHLASLAEKVEQSSFVDARGSSSDSVLTGMPILTLDPYPKVPGGRSRNDARQGSIDQDSELINFLESLTTSTQKSRLPDTSSDSNAAKDGRVTTTPLIEAIREKKAAKEKSAENKSAKHGRQTSKGDNLESSVDQKPGVTSKQSSDAQEKKTGGARRSEKPAAKENAKPNRKDKVPEPSKTASSQPAKDDGPQKPTDASPKKTASSAPATAAARMIQRDLGIRGGRGGGASRRGGHNSEAQNAQSSPSTTSAKPAASAQPSTLDTKSNPPSATQPTTPDQNKPGRANQRASKPPAGPSTPTEPRARIQQPTPSTGNSNTAGPSSLPNKLTPSQQTPKANNLPTPPVTPGATKAFLKHANASQGITEPLIETALTQFGPITHVEIDKRKGFAYADFASHEGLRSAVAAGSVPVAQGSVMVLERKDRATQAQASQAQTPPSPAANARSVARGGAAAGSGPRGRRGGARGGRAGRGGSASSSGAGAASE
ncbi:MAG: hypothetical protein M1831_003547 [Alyxoria varia]|nr:MAG: hypothetical protein M1831_003547 [Alyxoria varia]